MISFVTAKLMHVDAAAGRPEGWWWEFRYGASHTYQGIASSKIEAWDEVQRLVAAIIRKEVA